MSATTTPTSIEQSRYKDQQALTMRSGKLAAQVIPHIGSTMCSLRWLATGLELLRQRPGERYLQQPYGGSFGDAERAGFDEMMPTIDACACDQYPWQGVPIPDHGELWSIPWEHEVGEGEITFRVHGVRFPYSFEKRLSFATEGTLRLDYRLRNLSSFDLPFLWAAHPDFALPADAELELPEGVSRLIHVFGTEGEYGETVRWPLHALKDGEERDLRLIRASGASRIAKYYVKGPMPEGWCLLRYPSLGVQVRLSFPVSEVPYFAFLPNEGSGGIREVFLEPCTSSFDRPDIARLHGELSVLKAHGERSWYLEMAVSRV
jgi:hypothetical protein